MEAIAKAAKGADDIFLATDPDREGEAISWHIAEILQERGLLKDKPLHRVVFTEITPRAIKEAMTKPRQIAGDLVDAQQARRALDYLVGFNLSPVLWRKVQRGLSAGRVQSPALRMIVEREEEIEAFIAREYWSIQAECAHPSQAFAAKLTKLDGQKFEQFTVTDGDTAEAARLRIQQAAQGSLHVTDVTSKEPVSYTHLAPGRATTAPRSGLSGCMIALIIGVVLFIPVVGILAAIALPAYQDYTLRAKVSTALPAAEPVKLAVVAHLQEHQACPSNDDAGFGPPASYASGQIDSITVGEFDTSLCGLELRLTVPGNDKLDGKAVWFEYDPAGNSWQCSSEIEDKYLPTHCRE